MKNKWFIQISACIHRIGKLLQRTEQHGCVISTNRKAIYNPLT